jgi:HAD superfamily hydrolase (TIGR01549 family)
MIAPKRAPIDLAALLSRTRYLLLDFDGPICSIFAGRPSSEIARELFAALRADGAPLPERLNQPTDPFDILRYAASIGLVAAEQTEARLRAAELAAVETAIPTPHAARLIASWRSAGRRVAAVSNNSQEAVAAYADRQNLALDVIVGRTSADPARLKPNPHLVNRCLRALNAAPEVSLLVGDSPSDIAAASAVGVPTVGYANKPGKRRLLATAGADVITGDLSTLALSQRRA